MLLERHDTVFCWILRVCSALVLDCDSEDSSKSRESGMKYLIKKEM